MIRLICVAALLACTACTSLSLRGTASPANDVGVTLGTQITPSGVSNSGAVSVRLF